MVALGSFLAGMLGSLTGLGGGVVIVPLLTLVFGVDIRYAIGASLVSVIATSSGAAAAYLREGYSNMRVGMFLEMATTVGAVERRISCRIFAHFHDRDCVWRGAALLGLHIHTNAEPIRHQDSRRIASRRCCGWTARIPPRKA